jgi:hypothetical protein
MADKKISQLTGAATPLAGTEVLPIVQSGSTVKVSAADVTAGRAVSALTYTSTVSTGTAPLTVTSTTEVANLRAANATSADTANAVKSNATTGVMQIAGPAAAATRIMTIPDANFTAARTDAAQTFTGTQTVQAAATQDAVALAGRAGGTGSYVATVTPTTLSASRTVTLPNADTTVPVATQVLTFSGPSAARTITLPDANFTAARTDTSQTFTGAQSFAASVKKNMASAGTSGSPAGENSVIYNINGNDRCALRFWNIAQNLDYRSWMSLSVTIDDGTLVDKLFVTPYSDVYVNDHFRPGNNNAYSLGNGTYRWTEVFAINGTINTSDANAKEQIESLSDAELRVAKTLKGLMKKFKYKDAVAKKGDAARIHVGVIAQEVQSAFASEGLDAERYGLFCKDGHYELNGEPVQKDPNGNYPAGAVYVEQLGIRYEQLLAFIIAAL